MKKKYIRPEIDIEVLEIPDVICTSDLDFKPGEPVGAPARTGSPIWDNF